IRQQLPAKLASHLLYRLALLLLFEARRQWMCPLGPVPVARDGLETHLPRIHIGLHDLVYCHAVRHVHCLRYCSGDEGLDSTHHLHVAYVVYSSRSLGRLEGTVEDSEVLRL